MLHTMSISKSSLYPLLLFCFVWCKSKITKTEIAILHRMYVQLKYDRLIKFCADWFLMRFVYGALLLIASITPKTFIGLKLYKYAPNKYIATFSTMDGIKIANAESHNGHCLWDFCKYTAPKRYGNIARQQPKRTIFWWSPKRAKNTRIKRYVQNIINQSMSKPFIGVRSFIVSFCNCISLPPKWTIHFRERQGYGCSTVRIVF